MSAVVQEGEIASYTIKCMHDIVQVLHPCHGSYILLISYIGLVYNFIKDDDSDTRLGSIHYTIYKLR